MFEGTSLQSLFRQVNQTSAENPIFAQTNYSPGIMASPLFTQGYHFQPIGGDIPLTNLFGQVSAIGENPLAGINVNSSFAPTGTIESGLALMHSTLNGAIGAQSTSAIAGGHAIGQAGMNRAIEWDRNLSFGNNVHSALQGADSLFDVASSVDSSIGFQL